MKRFFIWLLVYFFVLVPFICLMLIIAFFKPKIGLGAMRDMLTKTLQ